MPDSRLRRIADLSWRQRADLARAIWELALAQRRLGGMPARQIPGPHGPATGQQADPLVDRVAWAIPRAAAVVPWRADCLRQAEAARHWLGRHGITSELRLGARKTETGTLDAHAWLVCGDRIITGGAIDRYAVFE
jgi:hypothetical protein